MNVVLSNIQLTELTRWLGDHGITMYKIHHDLSDAVAVAVLIHKYYPNLVNLDDYAIGVSNEGKLANWETLYRNVLAKLGIYRSKRSLQKLANATPGIIENLMYEIMQLKEIAISKCAKDIEDFEENSRVLLVSVQAMVDGKMVTSQEKMIRQSVYEEAQRECEKKDAILRDLQERINQLEHQIRMREQNRRRNFEPK